MPRHSGVAAVEMWQIWISTLDRRKPCGDGKELAFTSSVTEKRSDAGRARFSCGQLRPPPSFLVLTDKGRCLPTSTTKLRNS